MITFRAHVFTYVCTHVCSQIAMTTMFCAHVCTHVCTDVYTKVAVLTMFHAHAYAHVYTCLYTGSHDDNVPCCYARWLGRRDEHQHVRNLQLFKGLITFSRCIAVTPMVFLVDK